MSLLDIGLSFAGLPEVTIKNLDADLPALERLAAAAKELEPLINQAMPIITKAWPDVVLVTPLIQQLIAFAKQKESES